MLLPRSLTLAIFAALLCGILVAAASNPQLCYTDVNQLAPNYIVPCWTSAKTDQYSCCKTGNKCLEHNSCYDPGTGVTYEYGCTDPTYKDENCPSKCRLDQQKSKWVGLVYCNGSYNWPDETWVCHHPDNCKSCAGTWNPNLQKLGETNCGDLKHDGQYVAFNEVQTISDLVPIPVETDIADYFSRNEDRWKTTATTAGSATVSTAPSIPGHSQSSSADPSATETAEPTPTSSKYYTKVLAIGCGVGIPAILGVAGFFIYYWRKHRSRPQAEEQIDGSLGEPKAPGPDADSGAYGYVHKAELPGDDKPISEVQGSPSQIIEMEGSTVGERTPLPSPFVSPLLSQYSDKGHGREYRVPGVDYSPKPIHELPG